MPKLLLREPQLPQPIRPSQRRGSVAAAAAEPGRHGDSLAQGHLEAHLAPAGLPEKVGCPPRQVVCALKVSAVTAEVNPGTPGCQQQRVTQVHGVEHGFNVVVAVLAAPEHPEPKVDLGGTP